MINFAIFKEFSITKFSKRFLNIGSFGHYMKIGNWKLEISLLAICFFAFASGTSAATLQKPANNLGLVGYWSFNEGSGTTATDFSGNGNTGTLTNGPTWVDGKRGKGLSFDGSDDYVALGSNSIFTFGTNDFTASGWIYIRSATGIMNIFNVGSASAGSYSLYWNNGNSKIQSVRYGDTADSGLTTQTLSVGQWYHVVATRSSGAAKVYINGVLDSGASYSMGSITANTGAIGNTWLSITTGNGSIDEVRIYNRALSATEVGALYNAGGDKLKQSSNSGLIGYWSFEDATSTKATDFSGNGKSGTLTNGPIWTNGKFGKALDFDGSNDRVLVGTDAYTDAELSTTGSLMGWFKLDALPSSGTATGIFDIEGYLGSQIKNTSGNTRVNGRVYPGGEIFGTTNLSIGVWYHYALTWTNGSTMKLYLNAVEEASGTAGGVGANAQSRTTVIGDLCDVCGTAPFNGSLDELRLYNRVLTQAEIAKLYQNGAQKVNASQNVTGTTLDSGLVGMWSFNGADISGTTAYDRSGQGNNGTLTNGPKPTIGKAGQALSFDGVDDYFQAPYLSAMDFGTGDFTISSWVKSSYLVDYQTILNRDNADLGNGIIMYLYHTSGVVRVWVGGTALDGTINAADGRWHNVVLRRTSGVIYIYVDGVLDVQTSAAGNVNNSNNDAVRIGRRYYDGLYPLNGSLDEVRIYNRALSLNEIKQLYNMGK